MLLLVHDMVDDGHHKFGHDLQDIFLLKISCGVGHNHRHSFGKEFKEFVPIVLFSEVNWDPMSHSLIIGGVMHRLL